MAKPFGQVGRGLPGLTSVCDRCRRLVGLPPIALLLQDGSVLADPLSHTVVLLREAATVSSKPG
jgi:hypothetical protein